MTARPVPAGDTDYESTGQGYESWRRADPSIAAQIHAALGSAQSVLNVGAGAGSYEPADRYVLAVEPSAAMRARRRVSGAVPAIDASAEALPLDDDSVDAAMAVFTVHQWGDLPRGLGELRRVARGPVVIMTLDPDAMGGFWLDDYVPERLTTDRRRMPTLGALRAGLGGRVEVRPVRIPRECTDGFVEAFYARPEALLDPAVRAAQSAWTFVDADAVTQGFARLADDLADGTWDARHGHWRALPEFVGPLVLVVAQ